MGSLLPNSWVVKFICLVFDFQDSLSMFIVSCMFFCFVLSTSMCGIGLFIIFFESKLLRVAKLIRMTFYFPNSLNMFIRLYPTFCRRCCRASFLFFFFVTRKCCELRSSFVWPVTDHSGWNTFAGLLHWTFPTAANFFSTSPRWMGVHLAYGAQNWVQVATPSAGRVVLGFVAV